MDKRVAEWLKQADYDMDTAQLMAKGAGISMPCSCAIWQSKRR
jgi:hypothetical protein